MVDLQKVYAKIPCPMQNLVSVIMPVHQYHDYIHDAIKSIVTQTYRNIELIIVDDSKDIRLSDKVKSYYDNRIKLIPGKGNGLAAALNIGIGNSHGEFVARMDSDDVSDPKRIERQLDFLIKNSLDICGCNVKTFGVVNEKIKFPEFDKEIKFCMLFKCPLAHPTVLAKSNVLKQNNYNPQTSATEDYELWTKLALKNLKFGNCQGFLLLYRTHSNQASRINEKQLQNGIIFAKKYTLQYLPEEISPKYTALDCGYLIEYTYKQVDILLNILITEIEKRGLNPKLIERYTVSLYSRILNYSFGTVIGYYQFIKEHKLPIDIKLLLYLVFKSIIKRKISYRYLSLFKKIY